MTTAIIPASPGSGEPGEVAAPAAVARAARNPWSVAARRLWHNKLAMSALFVFLLIVLLCLLAPLYVSHVSHLGPYDGKTSGVIHENGKTIHVIANGGVTFNKNGTVTLHAGAGIPIGPQWGAASGAYFFGADELGRDVGTRLLYGGRNSLMIGISSAVICTIFAKFASTSQ